MSYLFARSGGRGGFSAARRAFAASHCWSNSSYGASNNAASAADEITSKLMHQRSSVRRVRSRHVHQRHTTSELMPPFGFHLDIMRRRASSHVLSHGQPNLTPLHPSFLLYARDDAVVTPLGIAP